GRPLPASMAGGAGARPDQPVSRRVCYPFCRKHGRYRAVKRRDFITLLGGAAAVWPFAARAQPGERMRRVALLPNATSDDPKYQTWVGAFLQTLALSGWTIGRNLRIDTRWAGGNAVEMRRHAAELATLAPDVVLAHGTSAVGPLLQATRTVPIVFPIIA